MGKVSRSKSKPPDKTEPYSTPKVTAMPTEPPVTPPGAIINDSELVCPGAPKAERIYYHPDMPRMLQADQQTVSQDPYRTSSFRFLDLSRGLRQKVYSLLGNIQRRDGQVDEEFGKTRKSLLLVNRKIHREWAPTFVRTTTVIVHASKARLGYFDPFDVSLNPLCGSSLFESHFLKKLNRSKLRNIRAIHYDLRDLEGERDWESLHQLPKHLGPYIPQMSSLEKITIAADLSSYIWRPVDETPEHSWECLPERHEWETFRQFVMVNSQPQQHGFSQTHVPPLSKWLYTQRLGKLSGAAWEGQSTTTMMLCGSSVLLERPVLNDGNTLPASESEVAAPKTVWISK